MGPGTANENGKRVQEWQTGMANEKGAGRSREWQARSIGVPDPFLALAWGHSVCHSRRKLVQERQTGMANGVERVRNGSGNGKQEWQTGPGMANGNGKRERSRTIPGMANSRSIGVPDPFLALAWGHSVCHSRRKLVREWQTGMAKGVERVRNGSGNGKQEWQTGPGMANRNGKRERPGNGKLSKHWRSRPIPGPCLGSFRLPFQTETSPGMANGNGKWSGTGAEWVWEWQTRMANGSGNGKREWQTRKAPDDPGNGKLSSIGVPDPFLALAWGHSVCHSRRKLVREWQTGMANGVERVRNGSGNGKLSKHWRSRPIPGPCLGAFRLPFQTEIGPGMANWNGK